MPFSTRSGFAADAGESTATWLPSRSRGRNTSRKVHLAAANHLCRPGQQHLLVIRAPDDALTSTNRGCAEFAFDSLQCNGGSRGSTGASARGLSGANAALVDAELDLVRAQDTHKLHVRTKPEERIDGDLRAELLPAHAVAAEIIARHKRDEVRIADIHHGAVDRAADACNLDRALHHTRHAHAALDPPYCALAAEHAAGPYSAVRAEDHLRVAFALREPCSHAAGSVAA